MSSTPQPPKQPKFNPINIPDVIAQALQYDVEGFDTSDKDFAARFPGLVQSRQVTIDDAFQQLTGPLDPTVQRRFTQEGLIKGLSTTGGGNAQAGISSGSVGASTAAASIAGSVLSKQDYDRQFFDSLLAQNPERAFGLSGADVSKLTIANTGTLNQNNAIGYQNQIAAINAQGQAGVQLGQTIAGLGSVIGSVGGLYHNYSDARLKERVVTVGRTSSGIPIVNFNYKGSSKRYVGVIAQDVLEVFPDAVVADDQGFLMVDYDLIGVTFQELFSR